MANEMISIIVILGAVGAVFISCLSIVIAFSALRGAGMTSRMEEKITGETPDNISKEVQHDS